MKQISKRNNRGFTLVELSVVLFIIALVLGASLSLGSARVAAEKIRQTNERILIIEETLRRFITTGGSAIMNGVPCPADGSLRNTDANFGLASCAAVVNGRFVVGNLVIGTVPVRTLNLPDEYDLDGFGNRFTWISTTLYDTAAELAVDSSGVDTITIKPSAIGADITTKAIWMVISHGVDSHGAWRKIGGRIDKGTASDADEDENVFCGADIVTHCNSDDVFVSRTPAGTFDDLTAYRMRWQLVPPTVSIVGNPDPDCNRPPPGTADLTYNCPTAPKNCIANAAISTGSGLSHTVQTGEMDCVDPADCWVTYHPLNEAAGAPPAYTCIAPDGSYVTCAAAAPVLGLPAPGPGPGGMTSLHYNTQPDLGACTWWQF